MKNRIYFCMETKVREFYSRVMFSLLAAERGYSVVIGSRGHLLRFSEKLKKGIFLSNGNTLRLSNISHKFKKLGFKVGHLDEEGAITFDYKHHIFRFDLNIFEKIDFYFAVGEREKTAIISNNLKGNPEKKIYITGNNRFDILDKKFFNLYEEDLKNIKKKYGKFVLITTKFNKINIPKKDDDVDYIKGLIKSGYMRREVDRYYGIESVKNDMKTMNELESFLTDLNTNFPDTKFLLKPHPGEDFNYWIKFKQKIKMSNLEIIPVNEFQTNAFIIASEFIIASNCTTLLESFLLNKIGINFLPYDNPKVHYELTKALSINCYSKNELIKKIKNLLTKDNNYKKNLSEDENKILSFAINNVKENSVDKMLDYFDKLNFNDSSKDKYSIFSNIYIYRFREFLIKIFNSIKKKDKFLKAKQEYLFQKNPGLKVDEIIKIKDILCESMKLQKNKFVIKNIMPGLFSIEKRER